MRQIVLTEAEIETVMDKLQLRNLQLKTSHDPEVTNEIHRHFHYLMVNFFQDAGSSYPNKN